MGIHRPRPRGARRRQCVGRRGDAHRARHAPAHEFARTGDFARPLARRLARALRPRAARSARPPLRPVLGEGPPLQLTDGEGADASPAWAPDGRTVTFVRCEDEGCGLFSVPALGGRRPPPHRCAGVSVGPRVRSGRRDARFRHPRHGHRARSHRAPRSRHRRPSPAHRPAGDLGRRYRSRCSRPTAARCYSVGARAAAAKTSTASRCPTARPSGSRTTTARSPGPPSAATAATCCSRRTGPGCTSCGGCRRRAAALERVRGVVARDPGQPEPGDGRLVFEEWAFEINLWGADADSAAARPLVASTWWDKHPHLRADGARIAFISNRSGPPEVWLADGDGANPTQADRLRRGVRRGAALVAGRHSPRVPGPAGRRRPTSS